MASICILGNGAKDTAALLQQLCPVPLQQSTTHGQATLLQTGQTAGGGSAQGPRVWLIQGDGHAAPQPKPGDCVIINADAANWPAIASGAGHTLTYGFNHRASITASSVMDGSVQVCIQRGFRSASQKNLLPQEFRVTCPSQADPLHVLGAAAACAFCDLIPLE